MQAVAVHAAHEMPKRRLQASEHWPPRGERPGVHCWQARPLAEHLTQY